MTSVILYWVLCSQLTPSDRWQCESYWTSAEVERELQRRHAAAVGWMDRSKLPPTSYLAISYPIYGSAQRLASRL